MNGNKYVWLLILVASYFCWGLYVNQYPIEITSDDAFNFSRAVERFSVLEFRPHFPGYPAFVILNRVAATIVSPITANVWVSLLGALMLPLLVARIVFILSASWWKSVLGCVVLLMQPLLVSMALSGLSDPIALAFFLMAVISAILQRNYHVGFWLGLMLASRPSYFPLAMGLALFPLFVPSHLLKLKAYFQAASVIAIIGCVSLLFILQHDGMAYFEEGVRFTQGHFEIWGNTAEGNQSQIIQWVKGLMSAYGLVILSSIFILLIWSLKTVFKKPSEQQLKARYVGMISVIALIYWVWITLGQNPDNLRHWAPVLVLVIIVFSMSFCSMFWQNKKGVVPLFVILLFIVTGDKLTVEQSRQAPIQQAIAWFEVHPEASMIGTNYSVNLLRDRLGERAVYDMYYPSSNIKLHEAALVSPESAWRISGTVLEKGILVQQFSARFIGERTLYLYQIIDEQ